MLSFIKKQLLQQKQTSLKKKYPSVNIALHKDMPAPSVDKMADLARLVEKVNSFEPQISALSDAGLKAKTLEFREFIKGKAEESRAQMEELEGLYADAALQEEKDRIRGKIKATRYRMFEDILPEAFAVVREASRRHRAAPF